ncbi:unnamed protein product [Cunninghamella blakesleeana]
MSILNKYYISSINEKQSIVPSKKSIELYSNQYFFACALGGVVACGPTHGAVTPLDVVKCRLQVKPGLYKGVFDGWKTIFKTEGFRGIWTGVAPTFIGYSFQGSCKYGFYEYFKYTYANIIGKENANRHHTILALAASGSAEFIADIFLCPWESIKVRMQTTYPPYAKTLSEGFNKIKQAEGVHGFYKGIVPLWSRQIPYTCMKFATFETIVEFIYHSILSKPKDEYNKFQQLLVSFAAGYSSGILVALISHPADVIVSKLNSQSGGKGQQKSFIDIAKELGIKGVWTGLGTRIIMIGTLTALQWLLYDSFKISLNLPTTSGGVQEESKVK